MHWSKTIPVVLKSIALRTWQQIILADFDNRAKSRKVFVQVFGEQQVSLKVIAGTAKGRLLKTLPREDLSIRPMLGRMKKSIFDIVQFKIPDSKFLDLFAGMGSVGIEALSRGAKEVVFAELSDVSLSLIKHNVNMLGFADRARIVKCNIIKDFEILQDKYDIVFMGPPYKDGDRKALALTYPA
ncbi:MAG: RsmD family RNA methyltransferase, partial [Endomicrobium sp.]|nr:RsmD family RNA methyltransferase [Endomicrobium sp.]